MRISSLTEKKLVLIRTMLKVQPSNTISCLRIPAWYLEMVTSTWHEAILVSITLDLLHQVSEMFIVRLKYYPMCFVVMEKYIFPTIYISLPLVIFIEFIKSFTLLINSVWDAILSSKPLKIINIIHDRLIHIIICYNVNIIWIWSIRPKFLYTKYMCHFHKYISTKVRIPPSAMIILFIYNIVWNEKEVPCNTIGFNKSS